MYQTAVIDSDKLLGAWGKNRHDQVSCDGKLASGQATLAVLTKSSANDGIHVHSCCMSLLSTKMLFTIRSQAQGQSLEMTCQGHVGSREIEATPQNTTLNTKVQGSSQTSRYSTCSMSTLNMAKGTVRLGAIGLSAKPVVADVCCPGRSSSKN